MGSSVIRATIRSFWMNSVEAELLGCIGLALAEILECLEDAYRLLRAHSGHGDILDGGEADDRSGKEPRAPPSGG